MRKTVTCTLAVAVVALLCGTGCVYWSPYRYFHPSDQGGDPVEFSFRAGDEQFVGNLIQSRSIFFLPFVVLLPGHGPFHLTLYQRVRDDECVSVDVVELLDMHKNLLFRATRDNGILSPDHSDSRPGVTKSVFTKNPEWDGWYRRRSSTLGWPNSRPVRISDRVTELMLIITLKNVTSVDVESPRRTTVVKLRRFWANESGWTTDSVYGATGSMHGRRDPGR